MPLLSLGALIKHPVGTKVRAKFSDGKYYPGKIAKHTAAGYHIHYDDGDKLHVKHEHVKVGTKISKPAKAAESKDSDKLTPAKAKLLTQFLGSWFEGIMATRWATEKEFKKGIAVANEFLVRSTPKSGPLFRVIYDETPYKVGDTYLASSMWSGLMSWTTTLKLAKEFWQQNDGSYIITGTPDPKDFFANSPDCKKVLELVLKKAKEWDDDDLIQETGYAIETLKSYAWQSEQIYLPKKPIKCKIVWRAEDFDYSKGK